ncbi:SIS domain-containing protein [Capillimicrobium parvum]|uniref:SIS domain-containing protein n=1 Tax=Capillimicrobium parvum TaxID=2884022 RepID=UPI00216AF0F6|nr:SIS domain-containing protein [Capillimicrobium parvum]
MSRPAAALGLVDELLERRLAAAERYFEAEADAIARLCREMAGRFAGGGRLVALAGSPVASSDARHVAVEFVHPVIVGKRALPALALEPSAVGLNVDAADIVMGFEPSPGLEAARERGCLVVAPHVELGDPFVEQEIVETLYHVLWELVHVFLDRRPDARAPDPGASAFLYPFLSGQRADDEEAVIADVRASVLMKAREVGDLRRQTIDEGRPALVAAAAATRAALEAGATVLALGNGGSATDAMDAVADLRHPPAGWPARRALDLTGDPAILTAIANDIGTEAVFSRQVIAYGRPGDVLLCFTTSGNSGNVIAALAEGRRRGLRSIAFVGYDGGQIAADGLADDVVVSRSQHIPRIQEAQATAWHVLRTLIEEP